MSLKEKGRIDILDSQLPISDRKKVYAEDDVREAVEKWLKYMKDDGGELSYHIHKDKFQQIFGVWKE